MDTIAIKGHMAALTWDGAELTIKHRMLGIISVPGSDITGVELSEPRGPLPGRLTVHARSWRHKGMMPKEPGRFDFPAKVSGDVRAVYEQLVMARR